MQILVRRQRVGDQIRVFGSSDNNEIVFNGSVRLHYTTGRYIGYELGVAIVEVEWLGIPVPFRGVRVAIRAVCEILKAAVDLAEGTAELIAISPDSESVETKLERLTQFERIDVLPLPYLSSIESIRSLALRVCR